MSIGYGGYGYVAKRLSAERKAREGTLQVWNIDTPEVFDKKDKEAKERAAIKSFKQWTEYYGL